MQRYHFSIWGAEGQLGLAGAIFAETDAPALALLQVALDQSEYHDIVDAHGGYEPGLSEAEAGLSDISLYTNGIVATMDMFDEIESDDASAEDHDR